MASHLWASNLGKHTGVLGRQHRPLSVTLAHSLILVAAKGVLVKFWWNPSSEVCIRNTGAAGTRACVTGHSFNVQRCRFNSRSLYLVAKGLSPSFPPDTCWLLWKAVSGHGSSARAFRWLLLLCVWSQRSAVGSHVWHRGAAWREGDESLPVKSVPGWSVVTALPPLGVVSCCRSLEIKEVPCYEGVCCKLSGLFRFCVTTFVLFHTKHVG